MLRDGSGVTASEFLALTLREIEALNDVRELREIRQDFQTARIVAMIAASQSKHARYDPRKYMSQANREAMARIEGSKAKSGPMMGEEIVTRFRQMGMPIIDKRAKK